MANILLVDPDEIARRTMSGILARGNHRFAAVDSASDAWELITQSVNVDLVFVELELTGESGLDFIQRLKSDSYLKSLPVVVYTTRADRDIVKRVLVLRAQNFLLKPYQDEAIFVQIAKAITTPWRQQLFEDDIPFCQAKGCTPEERHRLLNELGVALEVARASLQKGSDIKAEKNIGEELAALSARAEEAGAWGTLDFLKNLDHQAQAHNWTEFTARLPGLDFSNRVIFRHLNPTLVPEEFLTPQELNAEAENQARAVWTNAAIENRCPVVSWDQLQREIDALSGCPVVNTAAASFQMTANGHPTSLNPLMDLVDKDPGLAAQMLIACKQLQGDRQDDALPLEDPRIAVGLLGELRLAAQGRNLVVADEQMMLIPPQGSWSHFWIFQLATARLARFTCRYLDRSNLEAAAYTAGLLYDLGKLLLIRLHPFAFQAVFSLAQQYHLPLASAERQFLGATTREMAVYFAGKHGLPRRFANVMRWVDAPAQATEDTDLVAIVALARHLCRCNQIGFDGDSPLSPGEPLENSAAWQVLRESVFPGFDLREFETKAQAESRHLKAELRGQIRSASRA